MGLIDKIIGIFGSKDTKFDKEMKIQMRTIKDNKDSQEFISVGLVSFSDSSYLSNMAGKMCIGKEPDEDYEKRLENIKSIVLRGHESVIAHSNIIMLILLDKSSIFKFIDVAHAMKFLYYSTKEQEDGTYAILVGGSIRAYKYFLREVYDLTNPICSAIIQTLYQSCESVFFADLIDDGIMKEDEFRFYPIAENETLFETSTDEDGNLEDEPVCYAKTKDPIRLNGKVCDIIYADNVLDVLGRVERYGFVLRDVLKLTACTIVIHDLSRIISSHFTRHEAGISQESQRYVNYSDAKFIDPLQFNDTYDTEKVYNINILDNKISMKSKDLGQKLLSIYHQLVDQGMLKQDARGFLLQNTESKLMMTFTMAHLLHFIKIRKEKAAQPEIQNSTEELIFNLHEYPDTTFLCYSMGLDNLIELSESPVYKGYIEELNKQNEDIDEVIEEVIEEESKII